MSCFTVSDTHLSALANYACRNNIKLGYEYGRYFYDAGREQELVDLLREANVRSVNARYKEDSPTDGAIYIPAKELSSIQICKLCDCLAYQCDEWDEFETSLAKRCIDDLRKSAMRRIPGYSEAAYAI